MMRVTYGLELSYTHKYVDCSKNRKTAELSVPANFPVYKNSMAIL